MDGNKMAKLLLLLIAVDLLLFSSTEALWGSRRRSCHFPSKSPGWLNNWHGSLFFICQSSKSIRFWQSDHHKCAQDRIHYFDCKNGPGRYSERNCKWTSHYVNDYDDPVMFKCEHNGFITGVKSHYNGGARDRRFLFRCCHTRRYIAYNCKHTTYVNHWHHSFSFTVPSGYFLTGAYSYHRKEDRRWKFEICQFKKCRA